MRWPSPGAAVVAWEAWRFAPGDKEAIGRRQRERLGRLVRHARTASPYYRHLYAGLPPDIGDLCALPPVHKRDLMENFDDWVTDPDVTLATLRRDWLSDPRQIGAAYRGRYHVLTTSGTSGEPAVLLHDAPSWRLIHLVGRRGELQMLEDRQAVRGLLREGLRTAALFVTGGHFGGQVLFESARHQSAFVARHTRLFSVLRPIREIVAELNDFRPTVLAGYPSALARLAAEQRAGQLRIQPVLAFTAGEDLSARTRAEIVAAFGCTVQSRYAASEVPALATECREALLHVNVDWYVIEPVDQDDRPVPAGVASHTVLVTNLANRVQPLIRYDLGDRVELVDGPCACGNRLPAIRVRGRTADLLEFASARGGKVRLLPLALGTVIEETPGVRRFQAIRTGPTGLSVRLETFPGADPAALWRTLNERLSAFFAAQGCAPVSIERSPEAPRPEARSGKFRQVFSA